MQCERCRSGAAGVFRVRTDILDMVVCAACADEARNIGIPVVALEFKKGPPSAMIRHSERDVEKLSRTARW
jgi:hypothetical protein